MIDAVEEYLYALKPVVDSKLWEKATGSIKSIVEKNQRSINENLEKEKKLQQELLDLNSKRNELESKKQFLISKGAVSGKKSDEQTDLDRMLDTTIASLNKTDSSIAEVTTNLEMLSEVTHNGIGEFSFVFDKMKGAGASISSLLGILSEATSKAMEILEKSTEMSNKFVSGNSMFVDTATRDKMLKFGVSSTTAQSIIETESLMGIDASDYALLTEGQRELFDRLMQHYEEGLENIDPQKLEEFNEAMQEYQLRFAEFKMDLKLGVLELFAESDALKDLGDTVMDFLESLTDLLSSPLVKFGFDSFIKFLDTIISILSVPFKLIGGIGGGNTTTTTTNNYNNTTNNYGGYSPTTTNPLYIQQANRTLQ